jgi:hypothetical protein
MTNSQRTKLVAAIFQRAAIIPGHFLKAMEASATGHPEALPFFMTTLKTVIVEMDKDAAGKEALIALCRIVKRTKGMH